MTEEQEKASQVSGGAVLVLAGAGSGKTTTLIARVRNTIRSGNSLPEEILIMTFSRKASEEIRERASHGLGEEGGRIHAGTFHSVALSVLREYSGEFCRMFRYPSFPRILDEENRQKIFKSLFDQMKEQFLGLPFAVVMNMAASVFEPRIPDELKEPLSRFKDVYRKKKKEESLADFDDIIEYAACLIESDESIRETVQRRYRYIFADEYQDVSEDIFRFLSACTGKDGNLFAVGDDRQSIYGFRGAEIDYMLNFKKFFPDAVIHNLSNNFRSFREIVELSDSFISRNKRQHSRPSYAPKGYGGKIESIPVLSEKEEFDFIHSEIVKKNNSENTAVLFRNNWQGERLRKYFEFRRFDSEKILLMTIHASKGLEFDNVLLSGIHDEIFPSPRTPLEEERRLFYVALTRARKKISLLYRPENDIVPLFVRESSMSRGWMIKHPLTAAKDALRLEKALRGAAFKSRGDDLLQGLA